MTYNEFLNSLIGGINIFINNIGLVADTLIHNYIFITFLGIILFISLFWLFYDFVFGFFKNLIFGYDDYNDKYNDLVLKKQVQSDYLNNHYNDEFDYRYRSKVLSLQVLNGVYQNNKDLIIENKIYNLQANIDALKKLKEINLNDDNSFNDNDVDMLIPNPPVQLANVSELNKKHNPNIIEEYPNLHKELVKENNDNIDRILNEYSFLYKNKPIVNNYDFDLSKKPISNEGKYNFLKNNPQFLSDDWIISDKGYAVNKETGEVIEM